MRGDESNQAEQGVAAASEARRGSSNCAFVEEAWRRRLAQDYAGGPPPDAPYQLIPAVVSSYGGWHPDFAQ